VEGDDIDDPVSDNVRGILDGHIVLTRKLASRNHYPAVDVLQSISRLAVIVADPRTREACGYIRRLLATYYGAEDLISVGAYVKGSNAEIDESIDKFAAIEQFLIQRVEERAPLSETLRMAAQIAGLEISEEERAKDAAVPVQA